MHAVMSNLPCRLPAGNGAPYQSGRVAYTFGLQGPCCGNDTACSAALVAVLTVMDAGSTDATRGTQKEFQAVIAALSCIAGEAPRDFPTRANFESGHAALEAMTV